MAAGVDQALALIEAHFPPPFTLVSSLAQGADQLVVRRGLARWPRACLVVPLPLPSADYQQDFPVGPVREGFLTLLQRADQVLPPPQTADRAEAYARAGMATLDASDVLVAVWDGQPSLGQGGTGQIAAAARTRGLPLAWVQAGNRQPGTQQPVSLGERQGEVILEHF